MPRLDAGDKFPHLTLHQAGGGDLTIPDAFEGHFGVVLFYRGSWCPFCNAQLRTFQLAEWALKNVDARVVALSTDDEQTAKDLIDEHELTFPVGYGADAHAVSAATGAFVNENPSYLQSTGFVLDPSGRVVVSVYSSGAIGRLIPADVVGLVQYVKSNA
jgi:peroxiredoxin